MTTTRAPAHAHTGNGSGNTAAPLSPDELLQQDNIPATEPFPQEMRTSMSERRIHVSAADGDVQSLTGLADELASSSSFVLPRGGFLGRLGVDGRVDAAVPKAGRSVIEPYRPPWSDHVFHPKLAPLPQETRVRGKDADRIGVHTIYPPENRTPFRPEGYPWSCVGRVEVFENGVLKRMGTASLVGRRTILTSGHLMPRDGSAGRWGVRFVPGFFDGNSTAGLASWCEAYRALVITVSDSTQDRDIAVLKLYNPLGDALGFFGMRTYDDDWEDRGVWTHVGYPGDITNAQRPIFQAGIPVIDDDPSGDFTEIEHRGDCTDGDSGGPLFAQFPAHGGLPAGPYIVGVHSGFEYRTVLGAVVEDNNVESGGAGLVNMVIARNAEWP